MGAEPVAGGQRRWTWRLLAAVFRSLKIEPFVFLFVLSTTLSNLTTTQLIQDKICINNYNKSVDYCISISTSIEPTDEDDHIKNNILADLAQFQIYTTIISTLPACLYLLFIGPFIDHYIHGRKLILMLAMVGYGGWYSLQLLMAIKFEWDVHLMLVTYIPVVLFGGWSCVMLTVNSYLANNSLEEHRFIRFALFELALCIAGPVGGYVGGQLLGAGNWDATDHQIHNYNRVYLTSIGISIVAFIWVVVVINETRSHTTNDDVSKQISQLDPVNGNLKTLDNSSDSSGQHVSHKFRFRYMFDVQNVGQVFRTAFKRRPNRGRTYVWLLYLCLSLLMMADTRAFTVLFPYVERVYGIDAQRYSSVLSVANICQAVIMSVAVPVLSKRLHLSDAKLAIIGFMSLYAANMSIGSILSPWGWYAMLATTSLSGFAVIGVRSLISKIVPEGESGRVFCLLGAFETVFPTIQSVLNNTLFRYTIDWYPSMCFQTAGAITLVPIYMLMWIDLTYVYKL